MPPHGRQERTIDFGSFREPLQVGQTVALYTLIDLVQPRIASIKSISSVVSRWAGF